MLTSIGGKRAHSGMSLLLEKSDRLLSSQSCTDHELLRFGSNTINWTCIPLLTMTSFFKKVRFVREIALHSNDQDAAWRWKTVGMARPGVCGVS